MTVGAEKQVGTPKREQVRTPLSRERVIEAAISMADVHGLDGLSMRTLARELGVEAMSLYHWFRNKNELLEAMLGATFAEMGKPADSADWQADMRAACIAAKDTLLRHKWAAKLLGEPMMPTMAQFTWMDSILGRLRAAGFSRNLTHHAYHALDSHIVGYVLWLLPVLAVDDDWPDIANQIVGSLPEGALTAFIEHVEEHLDPQQDDVSEFEFGLDLLLDGLERMRIETRPQGS